MSKSGDGNAYPASGAGQDVAGGKGHDLPPGHGGRGALLWQNSHAQEEHDAEEANGDKMQDGEGDGQAAAAANSCRINEAVPGGGGSSEPLVTDGGRSVAQFGGLDVGRHEELFAIEGKNLLVLSV